MLACFDDEGRLYIAESDGQNLKKDELLRQRPRFVRRLEDVDGDGRFDRSKIFCDSMIMPEGALWHDGALYIVSSPYLWRLEDTDGDGVADKREKLLGYLEFDGRANQHGPFLGPNGRLFFSGGHFGVDLKGKDGSRVGGGLRTAGVFSCTQDGSDVEVFGLGPINPVEIVFTPEGDLLSTNAIFDSRGGRHDALVHWVRGGMTTRVYGPAYLPDTGVRLPPLSRWGQVAPAGLMRYRGKAFGPEYENDLFACQFNTRRVVRVELERQGSTFRSRDEDFLVSSSVDFHPTEILEDADGSLILIDTGGWLSWGCPFSKIAKPQIRGAIYRIRRAGAAKVTDGRGEKIDWAEIPAGKLVKLLDDDRPYVRDRAREVLIARGEDVLEHLGRLNLLNGSVRLRRNITWTISRIPGERSIELLRGGLLDPDASVRQAVVRSLGSRVRSDSKLVTAIVEALSSFLRRDVPPVRGAAATALGKIGDARAVPAIFESLQLDDNDAHLRHALVGALIEIDDAPSLRKGIQHSDARVRLAALTALDQSASGSIEQADVEALLADANVGVRARAVDVVRRRGFGDAVRGTLSKLLRDRSSWAEGRRQVEGVLTSLGSDDAIRALAWQAFARPDETFREARIAILRSFERGGHVQLDAATGAAVTDVVRGEDAELIAAAIEFLRAAHRPELDAALVELSRRESRPISERVAALAAGVRAGSALSTDSFELLRSAISERAFPVDRVVAARALGRAAVTDAQRRSLLPQVRRAGAMVLPHLLGAFEPASKLDARSPDASELSTKLADALLEAPGLANVSRDRVEKLFELWGRPAGERLARILTRFGDDPAERAKRLAELDATLLGGDPVRGEAIFHGTVAACSTCHRVGGVGGEVGPNLSKIGGLRARRDLLEAVVFPSSTLVNGYESWQLVTKAGTVHAGVIRSSTNEAVEMATGPASTVRIPRSEIARLETADTSIMPKELDEALSARQLADLIRYLQSLE